MFSFFSLTHTSDSNANFYITNTTGLLALVVFFFLGGGSDTQGRGHPRLETELGLCGAGLSTDDQFCLTEEKCGRGIRRCAAAEMTVGLGVGVNRRAASRQNKHRTFESGRAELGEKGGGEGGVTRSFPALARSTLFDTPSLPPLLTPLPPPPPHPPALSFPPPRFLPGSACQCASYVCSTWYGPPGRSWRLMVSRPITGSSPLE